MFEAAEKNNLNPDSTTKYFGHFGRFDTSFNRLYMTRQKNIFVFKKKHDKDISIEIAVYHGFAAEKRWFQSSSQNNSRRSVKTDEKISKI